MEIIKTAVKVGNSAGVLLPKKWLNSSVKITLEPLNIERDVIGILIEEEILKKVMGIYLTGSYARNEQTIESDVDVLAITSDISKRIKRDKYEIICVSKKELENQLNENALPLLAMIKEAKTIINEELIKEYSDYPLNEKNLRYHIKTTKSAMKVVEKDILFSKEIRENASDASAYSLILRLRTFYIIDCIKNKKIWSKNHFLNLIKKISKNLNAYELYLNVKNKNTLSYKLNVREAEKLMNYINKNIEKIERWLKEKKD